MNQNKELKKENTKTEVNKSEVNEKTEVKQTIIDGDKKADIKINSIINSTTVINCSSDIDREKIIKQVA